MPDKTSPNRKTSLRADDTFESINELGSLELMSKDLGLASYGPLKKSISADSLSSISSIGNNFGQDFTVGQVEVSMEYDGKAATLHVMLLQGKDLLEKEDARFESCFMRISLLPAEQIVGISRVSRSPPCTKPRMYVASLATCPLQPLLLGRSIPWTSSPRQGWGLGSGEVRTCWGGVQLAQDFWSPARGGFSVLQCRGAQRGWFVHRRPSRGRNFSLLTGMCDDFVVSERGLWQVFLLDFPCSGGWGCCGRWRKRSGVGCGERQRFGHVLPVLCHVPTHLIHPNEARARCPAAVMLSLPARDAVAKDPGSCSCTSTARTGGGLGAKPPFLGAPKAALGKQEPQFSFSSCFLQSSGSASLI